MRNVAAGLLAFQLASGAAIFFYLLAPLAQRSADDLGDLLILSAHVWSDLPPERRPAFVQALQERHELSLRETQDRLGEDYGHSPYVRFLRAALTERLAQNPSLRVVEDAQDRFEVEFAQDGHFLHFEFSKARLAPQPARALAWIVLTGVLATLLLAYSLARRVTASVSLMAEAARRIGQGGRTLSLPETGEAELAELARVFNATARQLEARRENQSTLLAGVSHDLRSPLARMKMAAGLLAEICASPLLARMERDISEMDALLEAQLSLARAQEPETPTMTDLRALLEEALDSAEAQAPGRLRLRPCLSVRNARLAPSALKRCTINLLDNALRYGGPGRIELAARRFGNAIFVGVRDRGPGIPPEMREIVFRPFRRLESSRSRKTGGCGLGLAIVRQLAESQGWRVALKSRAGGGLSVWLAIPID